jgi:hypothetical protein
MKLLAGHTGALLFERIGPIAPDEINSPLLDLVDGQGSQLDQVDSLSPRFAVNRRFLLSCFSKPVDVGGDLAQRDRIAFNGLEVDCAVCLYSVYVFANRYSGLFLGKILGPAPAQGFFPAVCAKFQIKPPCFDRRLRLVRRSEIGRGKLRSKLRLHAHTRSRFNTRTGARG